MNYAYDLKNPFNDYLKNSRAFGVGFDEIFKTVEEMATSTAKILGYPPYNIVKVDENKYLVELAVAGFGKQDIEIEFKDNSLVINGKISSEPSEDNKSEYLYKGIADRAFTRSFKLADTVEIKNAELINGMLKIWLENIIPDHKKPRKVEIV